MQFLYNKLTQNKLIYGNIENKSFQITKLINVSNNIIMDCCMNIQEL